ncbi:heavy metal translocating P-type ATPase [Lactococcus kimchii]|uniref:heavy metal translocating P-type ATPase n=1 Tax=Lactococcus sp. S-13 TaxID=2507158 RepID=UPI001022E3AD|nr:heavy metal translocating P-type ATPase [Lactococcus sp. S-13]RZI48380.1 heavy metal translocating P-type ATPase [Lactococcus sp. S-13]
MIFQKWLYKNANRLMALSGLMIVLGYVGKYGFKNDWAWNISMLLASILGGVPIAIHAYQALRYKQISIDLLVTIAVLGAIFIGEYEESAIVTFLFTFGSYLEKRTLEKTRSSIKTLTQMAPATALFADGKEVTIDEVNVGNQLLVRTGSQVPVDGVIYEGTGLVNEASITGEAREIRKSAGDKVFAGSFLANGSIYVIAEKIGEDTIFGKIIELVEQAQDMKSSAEKFIDRFAKFYTPAVLLLAIVVWLWSQNLALAITILVLGCPGALVIGAPVSNVAGIGNGAKNGVLIKGGEVIHTFSRVDTLLFDKTGTLTKGTTQVVEVKTFGEVSENLLTKIATVEGQSNHPLAHAIVKFIARDERVEMGQTDVIKGQGIIADEILIGNEKLLTEREILLTESQKSLLKVMQEKGSSTVLVAQAGQLKIIYGIADEIRPGVKEALTQLRRKGMQKTIMLTGDNEASAKAVASQLGIDEVHANLLPEDKAKIVEKLKKLGHKLAFVGDGINDSPSIALADIGIAMGSGTDVAIETSDIVLMKSSFDELVDAYTLAKSTVRNMTQNIALAIAVVIFLLTGLILGGTGLVPSFVNMGTGMFVHEASILVVILNGMRLISYKAKS